MEQKIFVYPEIEIHKPYRTITRETPLENNHAREELGYTPKNIDAHMVLSIFTRDVSLNEIQWLPKDLTRQKAIDCKFIQEDGGINLCISNQRLRGIREGGLRLARHMRDYNGPTALEIISWGVGVFRKVKTEQDMPFMKLNGEAPLPKVTSQYLKILQYQLVPYTYQKQDESGYINEWATDTYMYESTNLILADSYGELEQLQHRSKEKAFLNKYLEQLKSTTEFKKYSYVPFEAPGALLDFGDKIAGAWLKHIKNGIWKNPPQSTKELSDRVNFLLENTIVDINAEERTTDYEFHKPAFD